MDTREQEWYKGDNNKRLAKVYSHKTCISSEIKNIRKGKERTSIAIQGTSII